MIAGGGVMAVGLNALGIPSPGPNLGLRGLVGHLARWLLVAGRFHLLPAAGDDADDGFRPGRCR